MPVEGLDRLRRKFKRLPQLAREEIRKAMEQSASEIVAMMKSLVPVASGDLQESIGWTWGEAPEGAMVIGKVRGNQRGRDNPQITIYAGGGDAFYARMVEFGTSPFTNGGKFAGSENPGTAAQPYFFPSWRAGRKRAKGRVTRAINKAAKRAAAGG